MKDICIIYSKENKSLSKKLVSKLESDGIACMVAPRDFKIDAKESLEQAVIDSKILLLIVGNNSAGSKEQMTALEIAMENELEVIPFVVDKIESNLYTEYFFYAFSWVDAYEDSFEEAYEVLLDAYEELSGEKTGQKKKTVSKKRKQKAKDPKQFVYAVVAVLIIIVGYLIYDNMSESEETSTLVGKWRLADYHDNLKRSKQDSAIFLTKTIPALKQRALLIFNENKTFERRGFTREPQIGTWSLNSDGTILTLIPNVANAKPMEHKIEGLTENKFTIVVDETIVDTLRLPNGQAQLRETKSNTRLTFMK